MIPKRDVPTQAAGTGSLLNYGGKREIWHAVSLSGQRKPGGIRSKAP